MPPFAQGPPIDDDAERQQALALLGGAPAPAASEQQQLGGFLEEGAPEEALQMDAAEGPPPNPGPASYGIEGFNESAVLSDTEDFYRTRTLARRPYEIQWYLNAAGLRGQTGARWNPLEGRLGNTATPSYRRRTRINRIRAKFLAKIAKFVNGQIRPQVIPASTDREDLMNARGTEMLLVYLHRKLDLESKYEQALGWSEICGKSFWWFRWDDRASGTSYTDKDVLFGERKQQSTPIGEVCVDVGPAFQVLVDDDSIETLGRQRRIMRVMAEPLGDLAARFPEFKASLRPDAGDADLFQYQRQIAELGTRALVAGIDLPSGGRRTGHNERDPNRQFVIRKEMFEAPSATYPEGRYWVVAGGRLLKYQELLPYGWATVSDNPYPCEEFSSGANPGQFWPTTMIEQLLPVSQEYDEIRQKLGEALALSMHPKLMSPRQARIPTGANGSEPNQQFEYHWIPGMPPPNYLEPRGVNSDAWRLLDVHRGEFDEVSNIFPDVVGNSGGGNSGFQTNLLQEAADAVHQPDRRRNERSLARAYGKIRRLAKLYYDQGRLIQVGGRSRLPEVLELTHEQIDEFAEILVMVGSALPESKTARVQAILELHGAGLFGAAGDPETGRKVRSMIDLGGMDHDLDTLRRDEDSAQIENLRAARGEQLKPRAPWDNDQVHALSHLDAMKAPDFQQWDPQQQAGFASHTVGHLSRGPMINVALELAQMFQLPEGPAIQAQMQQQAMAAQQAAMMGQPPGAPAPGGPPAPPPV